MLFFVREGKYVTATNKFWFWLSILAQLICGCVGGVNFVKQGNPVFGVSMLVLMVGSGVLSIMFLTGGKRSRAIASCAYAVSALLLGIFIQVMVGSQSSGDYLNFALTNTMTPISTIWALLGEKKYAQKNDTKVMDCLLLKNSSSRVIMGIMYAVTLVGIIGVVVGVATGAVK